MNTLTRKLLKSALRGYIIIRNLRKDLKLLHLRGEREEENNENNIKIIKKKRIRGKTNNKTYEWEITKLELIMEGMKLTN